MPHPISFDCDFLLIDQVLKPKHYRRFLISHLLAELTITLNTSNSPHQAGKVQIPQLHGTDEGQMPVVCPGGEGKGFVKALK